MVVDMVLFGYMAMKYKYINKEDSEIEELDNNLKNENNALDNPALENEKL